MPKIFNLGNHPSGDIECNDLSPVPEDLRTQEVKSCEAPEAEPCFEVGRKKKYGHAGNCDPMQSGQIFNDMTQPVRRNTINRYSNALRGCDQGVTEMFKNITVRDDDGKHYPVPIMWGTQERAVAWVLQQNTHKDNSLIVDRPVLPLLAIHSNDHNFNRSRYIYHGAKIRVNGEDDKPLSTQELRKRDTIFSTTGGLPIDVTYTLYAWTKYIEDMNQIVEQVILKFSPEAYITIHGVPWKEIRVILDSSGGNIDTEPGDQNLRILKYQFNLTVETYIPQPITRNKSVLKIRTDFYDAVETDEITSEFGSQEIE